MARYRRATGVFLVLVFVAVGLQFSVLNRSSGKAQTNAARERIAIAKRISSLKLINFFPAGAGWTNMWTKWTPARMNAGFSRIASLHATAVRVIVPAQTFGFPRPSRLMTSRLTKTIELAARHGLEVELTLFDGWSSFTDIAGSERWARSILGPYAGDAHVAYIDLHNELSADTDPASLRWAQQMVPFVESIDRGVPVTVSTSISSGVAPLRALVDGLRAHPPSLYDVHYYGKASQAYSTLAAAKRIVSHVPLFVGETGFATDPSYPWAIGLAPDPASLEAYQDYYLRTIEQAALSLGLPPAAPWILSDFKPGAMNPGADMPAYQYHFGLFRTNGTPKPAAASISSIFATGRVNQSFNNDFRLEDGGLPAIWRRWEPTEADFSPVPGIELPGQAAGIQNATGSDAGCPSFYTSPVADVRPGRTYQTSVLAKSASAGGISRIVLAWFDANDRFIGQDDSPSLPTDAPMWTLLTAHGTAPVGTASVEIYLEVCHNPGSTWFDKVTFGPSASRATDLKAVSGAA